MDVNKLWLGNIGLAIGFKSSEPFNVLRDIWRKMSGNDLMWVVPPEKKGLLLICDVERKIFQAWSAGAAHICEEVFHFKHMRITGLAYAADKCDKGYLLLSEQMLDLVNL